MEDAVNTPVAVGISTVASKTVEKSDMILLPPQPVLSPSFLPQAVGW